MTFFLKAFIAQDLQWFSLVKDWIEGETSSTTNMSQLLQVQIRLQFWSI